MTRNIKSTSILDKTKDDIPGCSTRHQSNNSYSIEDLRKDMERDGVPWSIRPSMESLFIAHQNSMIKRGR